jgi:Leucine-rich repeat (LRR) protein
LHVVDLANNALANGTQVRLALSNVFFEGSNASVLDVRNNPLEPLDFYNLTSLKQLFVNHTSLLFASYALARLPRLVRVNSWTNGVMNLSSQGIVELPVPLLDSWTTGISTIDLSHNNLSSMRNIA